MSIKAKIIPELDTAILKNQTKGLSLGGAAVAGGIAGGIAGGVVGVVTQILSQFKPLMSIVKMISKVLIEFLRPIADMVTIMLMPILSILKPILMIFKTMMAPFRKAAFKLAGEASKAMAGGDISRGLGLAGLAMLTMLKPLIDMAIKIQIEIQKVLISLIIELLAIIFPFFRKKLMGFKDGLFETVDEIYDSIVEFGNIALIKGAAALGVDISKEMTKTFKDTSTAIEVFGNEVSSTLVATINRIKDDARAAAAYEGVSGGRYQGRTAQEIQDEVLGGGGSAAFMKKLEEALAIGSAVND